MTNFSFRKYRNIGDRIVPIVLTLLSIWDLRIEFQLLFQNFTYTSLFFALKHHSLAVTVLICVPSLWKRYGRYFSTIRE